MVIRASSAAEVRQLVADVRGDDPLRRESAIARLRVIGSRAVPSLSTLLNDIDPTARQAALGILEGLEDARIVAIGLRGLADEDEPVRVAAIRVLRPWLLRESSTAVLDALTATALNDSEARGVRAAALDALRQLPPQVVGPILDGVSLGPDEPEPAEPQAIHDRLEGAADAPLSTLHDLVAYARAQEMQEPDERRRAAWLSARGAVHAALARRGSRVALYDVREAFDSARIPLPLDFLQAITTLGDPTCIEPLARAWAEAPAAETWWRDRLASAASDIVARHRLTSRHAVVKRVRTRWPGFLSS